LRSLMRKLLFSVLLLSACHREAAVPMKPAVDPANAQLPLAARLQREAAARPTGTPRAEEVLAAFVRQGIPIEGTMQVLASTVGAAYCASAGTPRGLAIAVCEFPAEAEARQGMEYSHRTFDKLIPGRRLLLNHKTMLTVTGAPEVEAKRTADIFAGL
jgi:hypothetical protein